MDDQNGYFSLFNVIEPEDGAVMDRNCVIGFENGGKFGEEELSLDQNFIVDGNLDHYFMDGFKDEDELPLDQNIINGFEFDSNLFDPASSFLVPDRPVVVVAQHSRVEAVDGDSTEDYDFNDAVLSYINQILMEEDVEEKTCTFHDSAALEATEKSLYEVLGEKYPSSHDPQPFHLSNHTIDTNTNSCGQLESIWNSNLGEYDLALNKLDHPVSAETFLQPPHSNGLWMDPIDCSKKAVVVNERRKKKNPYDEDEGIRSNKQQAAVYSETTVKPEMFDMVLLSSGGKNDSAVREELQKEMNKNDQQLKASNGRKSRGKKSGGGGSCNDHKRNTMVDLTTLLILCAQHVSLSDWKTANDLLKQIRQHSSLTGDGMQRMAWYFANGLESRMAGYGANLHMKYPPSAAEVLKAYRVFLGACPFKKITNLVSNKSIMRIAKGATRLHIIDFGILWGFQWPCLIQRLSCRPGGPPKLRITGIDLPNTGFRSTERADETGRRLSHYAEIFNVPFSFHAIAQKWETIKIGDISLCEDEVLVVNCHWRFRNLLDETVVSEGDSPRSVVLNLIKETNPDVFVMAVVNGSYSAPFFGTRFREAIYHFSSLFNMMDTTMPRDVEERLSIEKQIFGWEAMNVIACEGAQRIERPETYRHWQDKMWRGGFRKLALDGEVVRLAKERVNGRYHKDFVIDADEDWMLQGWKGRILYALSLWKATV